MNKWIGQHFFSFYTLESTQLWGGDHAAPAAPGWELEMGRVPPLLQPGAPPAHPGHWGPLQAVGWLAILRFSHPAAHQGPRCQEELQAQPENTSPPGGHHHVLLQWDTEDVSRGRQRPEGRDWTNHSRLFGRLDGLLWLHVIPRRHSPASSRPLWTWEVCVDGSRDTRWHARRDEGGGGGGGEELESEPGEAVGHSGSGRGLELPRVPEKSVWRVVGKPEEPTGSGTGEPRVAAGASDLTFLFWEARPQLQFSVCVKVSLFCIWVLLRQSLPKHIRVLCCIKFAPPSSFSLAVSSIDRSGNEEIKGTDR